MHPIAVTNSQRPDLGGNFRGGDNACFTPRLWKYLVERFGISSVLDVGCGEGQAVKFFRALGLVAHGIEGLIDNVSNAVTPISLHDITRQPFIMPVDLVVCTEVVEHIEESFLENLINTLINGRVICMTHAVPNQEGHHHVNCQPSSYWIEHICSRGYNLSQDNELFKALSAQEVGHKYFATTGLVFYKL